MKKPEEITLDLPVSRDEFEIQTAPASSEAGSTLEDFIVYREAVPEDLNFIRKNWLKIGYDWIKRSHLVRPRAKYYYESRDKWLARLFEFCPVVVACDKQDTGFIYGFVAGWAYDDGGGICHFVYVRPEFRKRGLAKKLLAQMGYTWGAPLIATTWSHFIRPALPAFVELDEDQLYEACYVVKKP